MTAAQARRYVVSMTPPNVTGSLHLGHALELAVQDALVRSARLDGRATRYVPGTDHAGSGTWAAVRRDSSFRPELPMPERIRAWSDHYRRHIITQLRDYGLACDWDEERFTLDPRYRTLVVTGFRRLAEAGLIERRMRVMPWCPRCLATVPDTEQSVGPEHVPVALLPLRLGNRLLVLELPAAEELWGAVAVAVPDGHWAAGGAVRSAVTDRDMPVLAAPVDAPRLVVPAFRQPDLELAQASLLPWTEVLDAEGCSILPDTAGMTREALRRVTVERFKLRTIVRGVAMARCGVCDSELIARRHRQWYLRLAELIPPVREAVARGELVIGPASARREAAHWLDAAGDWCISRQICWGQRIPAVICDGCSYWRLPSAPPVPCPDCGGRLRDETDVLDTWFSSAHWPLAISGWSDGTRTDDHYPVDIIASGRDILFFWVVRLLAIGTFLTGRPPARECLLHGLVLDDRGQKMSKSRGNVISLADGLAEHGRDVLGAALILACKEAEDLRVRPEIFTFAAAMREPAARLAGLVLDARAACGPAAADELEHCCRLAAQTTREAIRRQLAQRRFNRAAETLAGFATQVLRRYARARDQAGAPSVTRELLIDLAAVYEPFMPDAAALLRSAAQQRPALSWHADKQVASVVGTVLAAVEEAERLRGAAGIPAGAVVTVTSTDRQVAAMFDTAWFRRIAMMDLAGGASDGGISDGGAFAVSVQGAPAVRLWLPVSCALRVRRDAARRLRKTAQRRRRLTRRLSQIGIVNDPALDQDSAVNRSRERLAAQLSRTFEDTEALRDVVRSARGTGMRP